MPKTPKTPTTPKTPGRDGGRGGKVRGGVRPVSDNALRLMGLIGAIFENRRRPEASATTTRMIDEAQPDDAIEQCRLLNSWLQDRRLDDYLIQNPSDRIKLARLFGGRYPYLFHPELNIERVQIPLRDEEGTKIPFPRHLLRDAEQAMVKELNRTHVEREEAKLAAGWDPDAFEKVQAKRFDGAPWSIKRLWKLDGKELVPTKSSASTTVKNLETPAAGLSKQAADLVMEITPKADSDTSGSQPEGSKGPEERKAASPKAAPPKTPSPKSAQPKLGTGGPGPTVATPEIKVTTSSEGSSKATPSTSPEEAAGKSRMDIDQPEPREKTAEEKEFNIKYKRWITERQARIEAAERVEREEMQGYVDAANAKMDEMARGKGYRSYDDYMEAEELYLEAQRRKRAAAPEAGGPGPEVEEEDMWAKWASELFQKDDRETYPDFEDEIQTIQSVEDMELVRYKGFRIEKPAIQLVRIKNFLKDNDIDRTPGWQRKCAEIAEYLGHLLEIYKKGDSWGQDLKRATRLLHTHMMFEKDCYGKPVLDLNFAPPAVNRTTKRLKYNPESTLAMTLPYQPPRPTPLSREKRKEQSRLRAIGVTLPKQSKPIFGRIYDPVMLKSVPEAGAAEEKWHPLAYSWCFDGMFADETERVKHTLRTLSVTREEIRNKVPNPGEDPDLPGNINGPLSLVALSRDFRDAWAKLRGTKALANDVIKYCRRNARPFTRDIKMAINLGRRDLPANFTAESSPLETRVALQFNKLEFIDSDNGVVDALHPAEELWLRFLSAPFPHDFEDMDLKTRILADRALRTIDHPDAERLFDKEGMALDHFLAHINAVSGGPVDRYKFSLEELQEATPLLFRNGILGINSDQRILRPIHPFVPEMRLDWTRIGGEPIYSHFEYKPGETVTEYEVACLSLNILSNETMKDKENRAKQEEWLFDSQNFFLRLAYRLGLTIRNLERAMREETMNLRDKTQTLDRARAAIHDWGQQVQMARIPYPNTVDPYTKMVQYADHAQLVSHKDPTPWATEVRCKELVRKNLIREAYEVKTMIWPSKFIGSPHTSLRPLARTDIWSWADPKRAERRPWFFQMDRWPIELQKPKMQKAIRESGPYGAELPSKLGGDDWDSQMGDGEEPWTQTWAEKAEDRRRFVPGTELWVTGDTNLQKAHIVKKIRESLETPKTPSFFQRVKESILGKRKERDPLELPKLRPHQIARSVPLSGREVKRRKAEANAEFVEEMRQMDYEEGLHEPTEYFEMEMDDDDREAAKIQEAAEGAGKQHDKPAARHVEGNDPGREKEPNGSNL